MGLGALARRMEMARAVRLAACVGTAGATAAVAHIGVVGALALGVGGADTARSSRRSGGRTRATASTLQRTAVCSLVADTVVHRPAALAAGTGLVVLASLAVRLLQDRLKGRAGDAERTLLIGGSTDVSRLVDLFTAHPEYGMRPVATATADGLLPTSLPGGSFGELDELVAQHGVDHILVGSGVRDEKLERSVRLLREYGLRLSVLPAMSNLLTAEPELIDVRGLPLLTLAARKHPGGWQWAMKRGIDYAAALVLLALLSPLFALVALLILIDSRGPVFFRQERLGRNGQPFRMWKFRSMVRDAEARRDALESLNEASGPYFKMARDPRVTRIGHLLRRTCIDELPQLINVLRGEMSLVGPRPILAGELESAPHLFDWRLHFLPGMTGLWQVTGRSWLPVEEGMRMDHAYLEHWSLRLDLRIFLRTFEVMVTGERRPPACIEEPVGAGRYLDKVVSEDLAPRSAPVDLSVIVVTHDSRAEIEDCLRSLREQRGKATFEVIVVENASRDGTDRLLAEQFPEVRMIRKSSRDGFALNCNIGATAASGRHVMLLNPDTIVGSDMVDRLVGYLDKHPDVGILGPRLVYPDGSPQASVRRFPALLPTVIRRTPLRLVLRNSRSERRHLMIEEDFEVSSRVDWVLGAAMAIRGQAFRELGGLDEAFRLYCEDIDLCWRADRAGWAVHHLPTVVVTHKLSELTRRRFLTKATWWHFGSMVHYLRKHGVSALKVRRPAITRVAPAPADSPVHVVDEASDRAIASLELSAAS